MKNEANKRFWKFHSGKFIPNKSLNSTWIQLEFIWKGELFAIDLF